MRLLFVVNHAGFFLSHRLPIALAAAAAGHDVHVATPRSKHVSRITDAGLPWHEIRLSRAGINPFREIGSVRDLLKLYRKLEPDVVHHVTSKPVLYGTWAARKAGVGGVVNAISGLGHAFSARRSLSPLTMLVSAAYRFALRHPRMKVIFQLEEHRSAFLGRGWVREDEAVLIAGSGVDSDLFTPAGHVGAERVRVTFAARMLYTKGVVEVVAAARILKAAGMDFEFRLVGEPDPDNPQSVDLKTLRQWDAEGVIRYLGRQDDMPAVLSETDIFCFPSYYGEGIPKVLVEAAAAGVPIVTTDWPGCRDVVQHGVTGILVPIKDAGAVAGAIATLAASPDDRATMGRLGREKAVREYSLNAVIRQTLDLYQELAP